MFTWIAAFIIGWCGTGWPFRFPSVGGGGGEPGWPDDCPVCGQVLGGISAVVLYAAFAKEMADIGFVGLAISSFAAGSVGNSLISATAGFLRSAPSAQPKFGQ